MALIRINIADSILSESADVPNYKFAKVGGVSTLVLPSTSRGTIQALVSLLKDARKEAILGQRDKAKAAKLRAKQPELRKKNPEKAKEAAKQIKELNGSYKEYIWQARDRIKKASKLSRSHGFTKLNLGLVGKDLTDAAKLKSAKIGTVTVAGKRGTFKPKFISFDKFQALGLKASARTAGMTKDGTGGGYSAAKKRAIDKKRKEQIPVAKSPAKKAKAKAGDLDAALRGNPDKEKKKAGNVTLDSYTNSRIPGTKVSIDAHDHFPASKDVANIVKSLVEKSGIKKGKFIVKGDSIAYKLGTANFRMNLNKKTGKWDSFANFGGNGGGSKPGYSLKAARKGLEDSIKSLQKYPKVDRMAAQKSWMKPSK